MKLRKYVIVFVVMVIWFSASNVYAKKTILNHFTKKRQYMADALSDITVAAPATASSTGTAGQIAYSADYIYVCIATNTWKRTALSTWAALTLVLDDGTSKILLNDGVSALIGR